MGILIKGMDEIPEDGSMLVVRHDNGKAYIKYARTYGYSMELVKLPAVQPEHNADVSKKVERTAETAQNVQNEDLIQRKAAIDAVNDLSYPSSLVDVKRILVDLPAVQPEIIRCKGCIYYDPPHVENNGMRYEYTEMPEEAFDVLGTGLVAVEYGINVGGRCCRDYNVGYADDKRIYVPEDNYCGRAERRTDERSD